MARPDTPRGGRFRNALQALRGGEPASNAHRADIPDPAITHIQLWNSGESVGNGSDADGRDPIKVNAAVLRCVALLQDNIAGVRTEIRDRETKEPIGPEHPLEQRRRRPMAWEVKHPSTGEAAIQGLTWAKWLRFGIGSLVKTGDWHIHIDGSTGEQVPYWFHLPAGRTQPDVKGAWFNLQKWDFTDPISGALHKLAPQEVARVAYVDDPIDMYRGVGPLEAARRAISLDWMAQDFNESSMRDGVYPSILLTLKKRVNQATLTAWLAQFKAQFTARRRTAAIAAIGAQEADVKDLTGRAPKDMEHGETRKANKAEIACACGIPLLLLNAHESQGLTGEAGLKILWRLFFQATCEPLTKHIAEDLTEQLIAPIDPRLELVFRWDEVPAMREDLGETLKNAQILWQMGMPLNDIGELLQMGALNEFAGSAVGFISASVKTVEQVIAESQFPQLGTETETPAKEEPAAPGIDLARATAIESVIARYKRDELARDQALALLTRIHGLNPDDALALVGAEPEPKQVPAPFRKPEEEPVAEAATGYGPESFSDDDITATEIAELELFCSPVVAGFDVPADAVNRAEVTAHVASFVAARRPRQIRSWLAYQREASRFELKLAKAYVKEVTRQFRAVNEQLWEVLPKERTKSETAEGRVIFVAADGSDVVGTITKAFDVEALVTAVLAPARQAYTLGIDSMERDLKSIPRLQDETIRGSKTFKEEVLGKAYERFREPILKQMGVNTQTLIEKVVLGGIEEGLSTKEISNRILKELKPQLVGGTIEYADGRKVSTIGHVNMVARMEVATARSAGRDDLAQAQAEETEDGLNGTWITAGDEYVRATCDECDGEVVPYGEPFPNGLTRPHELGAAAKLVMGCRCVWSPTNREATYSAATRFRVLQGGRVAA